MLVIKTGKHTYRWLPKWDSQRKDRGKSHTWSSLVTTSNIGPPLCKHGQFVPVECVGLQKKWLFTFKNKDCRWLRLFRRVTFRWVTHGDVDLPDLSGWLQAAAIDYFRLSLTLSRHSMVITCISLELLCEMSPSTSPWWWVRSGSRKIKATKASKNIELNNFSIN